MIKNKINPALISHFSNKFIFTLFFFTIIIFTWFINKAEGFNIFENFNLTFSQIILVFVFYSISHLMRLFRLAIIAGSFLNIRFFSLALFYFNSALIILITPFKLAEIYRICILSKISKNFLGSVLLTVVERSADAIFLFFIVLYICFFNDDPDFFYISSLYLFTFILTGLIFILWILGPILNTIHNYVFEKNSSKFSHFLLKILYNINATVITLKMSLKNKSISILSFSLLIYLFEGLTIFVCAQLSDINIFSILQFNINYSLSPQANILVASTNIVGAWLLCLTFYWIISMAFIIFLKYKDNKKEIRFYD